MGVTPPPSFHHTDDTVPETRWASALARGERPELDLSAVQHLVVVAAHPDDETLMAGGLIAMAHARGIPVTVVVATDGEGSHPHSPTHSRTDLVALRRPEVEDAVQALAPNATLHMPGYADGDLGASIDSLVELLVDVIALDGAETLLVSTWRGDGHPDHEAAARAAASAAWRTDAQLLEAPIWWWHWGSPDAAMPPGPNLALSSDAFRAKRTAMQKHRSQILPLSDQPGDDAVVTPAMLSHFERAFEVFFDGSPSERNPFEELHSSHADPWSVHTSFYERRKRACTLAVLPEPTYDRAVELGCSVGALAADLAERARHVLAIDSSAAALSRAQRTVAHLSHVELLHQRIPDDLRRLDADLIVVSELGYFLSPRRMRELAELIANSASNTVVACHWRHDVRGWPLDGPEVHRILRGQLGIPHTTIDDQDFVLDVFRLADQPR